MHIYSGQWWCDALVMRSRIGAVVRKNTVYSAIPDLVWAVPERCLVEIEPILDFQMKE
jgi:hypothetical protein